MKRYYRPALLLAVVAGLSACATSAKFVPDAQTASALALLQQCSNEIQTAKGTGKLVLDPGRHQEQRGRFAWVAERSSALRLEVLGLWGQPIYRFLLRGDTFWLHDVGADEYFRGAAKGSVLKRILGFAVDPQHLHSLLLGCIPLDSFRKAKLDKPGEDGGVELSLYGRWGRLTQKVYFAGDIVKATRAEFFGADEGLRYTVMLDGFRTVKEGLMFPDSIQVVGTNGARIFMDMGSVEVNTSVPARTFQMGTPE